MLNKNLEFISNESLKERLKRLSIEQTSKDMSYCMTPTNDYLLMKNDVPLDDLNDPRGAIREMLKTNIKNPMEANDTIVVFGCGLFYLLDEVFNTYPSKIYLYEPDTELLHFVLSNVDISEHLSSGRVYLFDKLDDLLNMLNDKYITKDKVEVVYLQNYAVVRSQDLLELTQKVYETCRSKTVDINTITKFSRQWLVNTLNNINTINNSDKYLLSDLEDKFIGQTALILAAGPSLKENIEKIKANREKYVIFAVNKVLREILNNGITPDFVVCLDAEYLNITMDGLQEYFPKINCIADIRSDSWIYKQNFRRFFTAFASSDLVAKKIANFNKFIKQYEIGGSATTLAYVAAVKMGFSKIIFCGLDLAFKNDQLYADGEKINMVSENQISIGYSVKNLTKVKSVTGGEVSTREDYAAFIQHFEVLLKESEFTEVYNTTSFGALIEGMKNRLFDDILLLGLSNTTSIILSEAQPFKLETKTWTQEELFLINNVIALLSKNVFSPALVSSIVKSPIMYQYLQAEVLKVLQSRMDEGYAEDFMVEVKNGIKIIIETLQKNNLL